MFTALGLFKQIACPKGSECALPACIFSHESVSCGIVSLAPNGAAEYDPCSAGDVETPQPKRRKLGSPAAEQSARTSPLLNASKSVTARESSSTVEVSSSPKAFGKLAAVPTRAAHKEPSAEEQFQASRRNNDVKPTPKTITRPVSPPPLSTSKRFLMSKSKNLGKTESLTPRNVSRAPALLKTRLSVLQAMHQQMVAQNQKVIEGGQTREKLLLLDHELVKLALDEEEDAASTLEQDIYRNAMTQRVQRLKKMSTEEWIAFLSKKKATNFNDEAQKIQSPGQSSDDVHTGLSSRQEVEVLKRLRTPLEGLEPYGYVTQKPSETAIMSTSVALESAAGFETCDRCGTRFQVFPGRDDQGRLTTGGICRYHWAKIHRGTRQRADRITGQSDAVFPCCSRVLGSEGCTEGDTHVFKVTDPARLATTLQFEHTPMPEDGKERQPLSFDCEMAYTTYGLELIRVTAVSWPQHQKLLDVLVRPYGEVLDLNTRFSGVSKQRYAAAEAYNAAPSNSDDDSSKARKVEIKPLRRVDSPAAARQLMFNILRPDTPLIGHAIDNDLNTCRIIHPFVVDTVLLYPHPRGLPLRYGLKMLTQKYLNRGIQMGGETGHDSKEDAIATGDLVSHKVGEKWKMMKIEGWRFEDGVLVAPQKTKTIVDGPRTVL